MSTSARRTGLVFGTRPALLRALADERARDRRLRWPPARRAVWHRERRCDGAWPAARARPSPAAAAVPCCARGATVATAATGPRLELDPAPEDPDHLT
jgi:hypothetical protein